MSDIVIVIPSEMVRVVKLAQTNEIVLKLPMYVRLDGDYIFGWDTKMTWTDFYNRVIAGHVRDNKGDIVAPVRRKLPMKEGI